jgi:putative tricarboxylic transport membrane protein
VTPAFKVSLRRGELAIAIALVVLASYVMWDASRMPAGTPALPGPGFLPFVLGAMLAATGAGLVVRNLRLGERPDPTLPFLHLSVVVAFVALTAVPFVFERLGFMITMSVFYFVLLCALSSLSWAVSALVALGVTGASYAVFHWLLEVQLPGGPLPG